MIYIMLFLKIGMKKIVTDNYENDFNTFNDFIIPNHKHRDKTLR